MLQARFVRGAAMSAPLLKARLTATEDGSQLDGVVTWGAVYYGGLLHVAGLAVTGFMLLAFGCADRAWQPLAIGLAALALGGWLAATARRGFAAERQAYQDGFTRDLHVLLDIK